MKARAFFQRALPLGQGLYYLLTGLWPVVSPASFQRITGPKTDLWLVKTTGWLIAGIGSVLVLAGLRRRLTPETALLGASGAAALGGSGIYYSLKQRIRPVYFFEGLVEAWLLSAWTAYFIIRRAAHRR